VKNVAQNFTAGDPTASTSSAAEWSGDEVTRNLGDVERLNQKLAARGRRGPRSLPQYVSMELRSARSEAAEIFLPTSSFIFRG
jgi:hypothetical protein